MNANNMFSIELAMRKEVLAKINNRESLANMEIQDREIEPIMRALQKLRSDDLAILNLDDNNLTDAGAITLANCLRDFKFPLKQLSVERNKIGQEGLTAILSLKQKALPGLDIAFRGNEIKDSGDIKSIIQQIKSI